MPMVSLPCEVTLVPDPDASHATGDIRMCNLGDYEWDLPINEVDVFQFRSAYVSIVRRLLAYYKDVQIILIIGDSLKKDYEEDRKSVV